MNNMSFRKMRNLALSALVTLTLIGCTPKLDGKYTDASGMLSLEFKSGKAYVGTMAGQAETDYEVSGDKVTLKVDGQSTVLTINSDGSLTSEIGKFTKKP